MTPGYAHHALFHGTSSTELVAMQEDIRQAFVRALDGKRGTVKATPFTQGAPEPSDTLVAISGKWQSARRLKLKPDRSPHQMRNRGRRLPSQAGELERQAPSSRAKAG